MRASAWLTSAVVTTVVLLNAGLAAALIDYEPFANFSSHSQGYAVLDALAEGADGAFYGTTQFGGASNAGTIFRITSDNVYTQLYQFTGQTDGGQPRAGLLLASDGNFYGMAQDGGDNNDNCGTIFQLSPAGVFTRIYSFHGQGDGCSPQYRLIQGTDGFLYGTTLGGGGATGGGTLFKISTGTSGVLTTLHTFLGWTAGDGNGPYALIQASDGSFYGAAAGGPTNTSLGMVFGYGAKYGTSGASGYTILYSFNSAGSDGAFPTGTLAQGTDGKIYGTTAGTYNSTETSTYPYGTIFSIDPTSNAFNPTVYTFSGGPDGYTPLAGVISAADGTLYGTARGGTGSGGSYDGVVFGLAPDGGFHVLHAFLEGGDDGSLPDAGLLQGVDGRLYGSTISGGTLRSGTLFALSTSGLFDKLHDFGGAVSSPTDIALGQDGVLYGPYATNPDTNGALFSIQTDPTSPDYALPTTLYAFQGSDGSLPVGPLVNGADGALYGVTTGGSGAAANGTVFRIANGEIQTNFHDFTTTEGSSPTSLTLGVDDALYGLVYGGAHGYGTLFRMDYTGAVTVAHSFTSADLGGASPGTIVQAPDGTFYGTTLSGGAHNQGDLFEIAVNGTVTVLYSFTGGADGTRPMAPLLVGSDGSLYGTTSTSFTAGSVFGLDTNGTPTVTVLHTFSGGDGGYPVARLLEGPDGMLYGTTAAGGTSNAGVLFQIAKDGRGFNVLHNFASTDGAPPSGELVADANRHVYGVTTSGGTSNAGVAFRFTIPASGPALSVDPATGVYAGSTTLTAVLQSNGQGISDREIDFSLNGVPVGSATTGASGVATLTGVALAGINAGTHNDAIQAAFNGDAAYLASTGTASLTVLPATPAITWGPTSQVFAFLPLPTSEPVVLGPAEDASTTVAGTFTYVPPMGTVLPFGVTTLTATFHSADPNYADATATTTVTVYQFLVPVGLSSSGLAFSRVTQTFNATVTLTNFTTGLISGPFQLLLTELPVGVTVVNATGLWGPIPYITVPVPNLLPGQVVTVPIQFKNSGSSAIKFAPLVYVGTPP